MKDEKKTFFFRRKEPKNFCFPAMARMHGGHGRIIKVFCFFSSEKKTFLSSLGSF
jgi:hypothetical protein